MKNVTIIDPPPLIGKINFENILKIILYSEGGNCVGVEEGEGCGGEGWVWRGEGEGGEGEGGLF